MFLKFFSLTHNPFRAKAEGSEVFIGPQQTALMSGLKKVLIDRDAVALVMGPVGVGKSIAVARALDTYPTAHEAIKFGRMTLSRDDILEHLISGLGGDCAGQSTPKKLAQLQGLLAEREDTDTRVVAVVEDAPRLGVEGLLELESLTSADTGETAGANLVLMGSPDLHDLLNTPELARLKQRVSGRYSLSPLSREELRDYLQARVSAAGGNHETLFTASAIDALHDSCGGVPRVINRLASSVLSAAADADISEIDGDLINRVANGEPIEVAPQQETDPTANDAADSDLDPAGAQPATEVEQPGGASEGTEAGDPSADEDASDVAIVADANDSAELDSEQPESAQEESPADIPELIQDTLPPFAALKLPDGEKTAVELAAELRDKTDNTQPALPVLTTGSDDDAAEVSSEPELPRLGEPLSPQHMAANDGAVDAAAPPAGALDDGLAGAAINDAESVADGGAAERKPTPEEELDAAIDALAAQRDAFDVAAAAQSAAEHQAQDASAIDAPRADVPEPTNGLTETPDRPIPSEAASIAAAGESQGDASADNLLAPQQPQQTPAPTIHDAGTDQPAGIAAPTDKPAANGAASAFAELEAAVAELETAATGIVKADLSSLAEADADAPQLEPSAPLADLETAATVQDFTTQADVDAMLPANGLEAPANEADLAPEPAPLDPPVALAEPEALAPAAEPQHEIQQNDPSPDIAALAAEAAATDEALTNAIERTSATDVNAITASFDDAETLPGAAADLAPSVATESEPEGLIAPRPDTIPTLDPAADVALSPESPGAQPSLPEPSADGPANAVDSAFLPDTTFLKALEDPTDDPLLDAADLAGMEPPAARRAAETYLDAAPSVAAPMDAAAEPTPEQQVGATDALSAGLESPDTPELGTEILENEELATEMPGADPLEAENTGALTAEAPSAELDALEPAIPELELSLMADSGGENSADNEPATADASLDVEAGDNDKQQLSAEAQASVPEITLDDSIREDKAATKAANADAEDSSDKRTRPEAEQAKLKELAAQLGGATSLEEVDEVAAETLFGVEFTQLANTVTGLHASDIQSAADAELSLADDPAPPAADKPGDAAIDSATAAEPAASPAAPAAPSVGNVNTPPQRPTPTTNAPPVDIDSSAYRRLQMVRSLNGKPPTPPPEAAEEIVLGEATPPPHPIDPSQSPDRIEDQFGTSMTANLEALSEKTIQAMQQAEAEAETDTETEEEPPKKRGFFSRFKRS